MKIAILPATGLGDVLLMTSVAYHLKKNKPSTIFFYHKKGNIFNANFKEIIFEKRISNNLCKNEILNFFKKNFDLIILQNDNSKISKTLIERRKFLKKLIVFYPSHKAFKNYPLDNFDYVCNPNISISQNIEVFSNKIDGMPFEKKNNLTLDKNLIHRKNSKRVIIHPLSTDSHRCWMRAKYLKLSKKLEKKGFEPFFILTKEEFEKGFKKVGNVTIVNNLNEIISFIYESSYFIGNDSFIGHLASYLQIKTLTILNHKMYNLWRPGYFENIIIKPSKKIPNIKHFRIREKYWQYFITVRHVLKTFLSLT